MKERKKIKAEKPGDKFAEELEKIVSGLYFISETDSKIFPFKGKKAEAVSKETVISQTKSSEDAIVEEKSFDEFFARLIKIEDWFGEEEKKAAGQFKALREFLERNLKDLKVFKIGEIELDVYAVGIDSEGFLKGIKTKAVET